MFAQCTSQEIELLCGKTYLRNWYLVLLLAASAVSIPVIRPLSVYIPLLFMTKYKKVSSIEIKEKKTDEKRLRSVKIKPP